MSYLKIIEQPQSRGARFRYECEGRNTGSIYGASTREGQKPKTYPTVELIDYDGPAFVVISCVMRDPPYLPHPHKVIQAGGQCSEGICHFKLPAGEPRMVLRHLSIQCTKKKDIPKALETREKMRVDPFKTGFQHREHPDRINLNCVRLCFQVFIEGKKPGSFNVPLRPVVSNPIYDKKQAAELSIVFMSHASDSAAGGTSMCILADKVSKDDVGVRFSDATGWEATVETVKPHYHKQVAIVFRSPAYIRQDLPVPVTVNVELIRISDGETSKPLTFQYTPLDPDKCESPKRKQPRIRESPRALVERHIKVDRDRDCMLIKLANESQKTNQEQLLQCQPQSCKSQMLQPSQPQLHYDNPRLQQQINQQIQQMQKNQQQQWNIPPQQQPQQQWNIPPQQQPQQQWNLPTTVQHQHQQMQRTHSIQDPVLQRQLQILEDQRNAKLRSMHCPFYFNM